MDVVHVSFFWFGLRWDVDHGPWRNFIKSWNFLCLWILLKPYSSCRFSKIEFWSEKVQQRFSLGGFFLFCIERFDQSNPFWICFVFSMNYTNSLFIFNKTTSKSKCLCTTIGTSATFTTRGAVIETIASYKLTIQWPFIIFYGLYFKYFNFLFYLNCMDYHIPDMRYDITDMLHNSHKMWLNGSKAQSFSGSKEYGRVTIIK